MPFMNQSSPCLQNLQEVVEPPAEPSCAETLQQSTCANEISIHLKSEADESHLQHDASNGHKDAEYSVVVGPAVRCDPS
jgi:hypothetical protein